MIEPTIRVTLACLVLLSVCLLGCKRPPSSPSMTGLPNIDKAELFKLKKHGDLWNGEIERDTILVGNEAQDVARLWRAQSFSSDSPICHNPGYAIKFYDRDVQILYATLCWECDNIEFLTPQLDKYVGFDAQGAKGQELLKYLINRLESQSPMVSMRRTLDAAERAQRSALNRSGACAPADRIVMRHQSYEHQHLFTF